MNKEKYLKTKCLYCDKEFPINYSTVRVRHPMYDDTDFEVVIICPHCKSWMRKIPIGVPFKKCGNNIMVVGDTFNKKIEYIYGCDKCPLAISEEIYLQSLNK